MKQNSSLFIWVSASIILSSVLLYSCIICSKKIPCAGYTTDPVLESWFPYKKNDQLIFKTNVNIYDTFLLDHADSTLPYEYEIKSNETGNCSATKSFNTASKSFTIRLTTNSVDYSFIPTRSVSFYIHGRHFNGNDLTEAGFASFSFHNSNNGIPQTFADYLLGGTVYPLVQTITDEKAAYKKTPGVYKVIYAKNEGIIAYETNPGAITWIRQKY